MERWYRLSNRFGGLDWEVKAGLAGPRANHFFRDHVIDEPNGDLTIGIAERTDGSWGCAELRTRQKLHFGRYELVVAGDLAQVADNMAVFGLFNYPTVDQAPDGTNEIDVEIAQFAPPHNLNFTLYPKLGGPENSVKHHVDLPRTGETTLVFDWGEDHLDWQARAADGSAIATRSLDLAEREQIPDLALQLRMNLWLLDNQTPALGEGSSVRLIDLAYDGPAPDPLAEDPLEIVGLTDGQSVADIENDIAIAVALADVAAVHLEVFTDTWYPQAAAREVAPGRFVAPVARFYVPAGSTVPVRARAQLHDGSEHDSPLIDVVRR